MDLKSSKKDTQNIILQWINKNNRYNSKSWEIDIMAKRIIAWTSNSRLTYEDSRSLSYKKKFNSIIKKQINHLMNEIERSEWVDDINDRLCSYYFSWIILSRQRQLSKYRTKLIKKIIKFSFDNDGFPKSRSIRQLNFYLKYFMLNSGVA